MTEPIPNENNKDLLEKKEQKELEDQTKKEAEKNEEVDPNQKEAPENPSNITEEEVPIKANPEKEITSEIVPDQKEKTPPKRYFGIDVIRVLACYLVIQTHSGEFYYIDSKGGFIKNDLNIWPGIYLNHFL